MAKLNFKDLIFKFLQKDEDHDCEKVHPKMSHKEWMNTEPVKTVKENIEVYITKKGSGPVNKRSIVKDFNNKAEAEKWIKWYKTGNMKDVESIKLFDLAKAMKYMDNRPIDEATRPDPTQYGPDKVAKAMKIAVKSDGNYTGAVKEIEKIAKDLSKVSTIARALKTANEDYKSDYEKEQPIKVKKAIEIAKRMAGNHTGATKEIEKLAKGLSQLPVVKSVLMRVNESNDMGYVVKFAKKKDGKIETAWYRSKEDAEKALASLKKDGLNGIISKGRMDEEARDLKFGNITVITITKDGKRKEIEKKDLQRWKDDGWKLAEEAPANNASSGNVDMNPTGKKAKLQKKKDDILKRMGVNIKENLDNNNVVLKGVNDTLNTLEDKIDGFSGIKKEEVKLKPKKKTFNEKFLEQLADNTPHTGQFDEKL